MIERSCGVMILKDGNVLLIRHNEGHWGFPKGHMENNETEVMTALRETKEETNLDVIIDESKRYTSSYIMPNGIQKDVVFFIGSLKGKETIVKQDIEINDIKWVPYDEVNNYFEPINAKEFWLNVMKDLNL